MNATRVVLLAVGAGLLGCGNEAGIRPGAVSGFHEQALLGDASWTAEGNQGSSLFGYSVSGAGDVDGDGFSDVIVGAPYHNDPERDEGCAFVYHGSDVGLGADPAWSFGTDVIAPLGEHGPVFGWSVSSAGDVDGDGFDDVVVGAPFTHGAFTEQGRAYVFLGGPDGLEEAPAWTVDGDRNYARVGWSVSGAGDVNDDGFDDVVLGIYSYQAGVTEGRVDVYYGSEAGLGVEPAWTVMWNRADDMYGFSVSGAGDVNGDGFDDIVVGAPYYRSGEDEEGAAYVYHGSEDGLGALSWSTESNHVGARFGYSVSGTGDVNADGFDDVVIGARYWQDGEWREGRAYVYLGSEAGLEDDPVWTWEPDQAGAEFGASVGHAGDVDGDGFDDVVVGAYVYEEDPDLPDEGGVFLFRGSEDGPSAEPDWSATSGQALAELGYSVSGAGDTNGDGFDDVIAGAILFDGGHTNEGRVYLFPGECAEGELCPDGICREGECDSTSCLVDGAWYSDGDPRPGNPCEQCDVASNREAWTVAPAGTDCEPDALECTSDVCDGAGACAHSLLGGCLVDGVCYDADAADPSNGCRACREGIDSSAFSDLPDGTECDDGDAETIEDACLAGECVGRTPEDDDEEDAGPDGGTDGGVGGATESQSGGCGCGVAARPGSKGPLGVVLLALLGAALLARRF